MRPFKNALAFALAVAAVGGLSACDSGEDNLDFELGSTLTVVGPSRVTLTPTVTVGPAIRTVAGGDTTLAVDRGSVVVTPATSQRGYYVQAFTTTKDYAWTYQGSPVASACSGSNYPCLRVRSPAGASYTGEYLDVLYTQRGTYTSTVQTGSYQGSQSTTVVEPPVLAGCTALRPTARPGQPIQIDGVVTSPIPSTLSVDLGAEGAAAVTGAAFPLTLTYATAGDYTAMVTATNADGTGTCTVSIKVRAEDEEDEED